MTNNQSNELNKELYDILFHLTDLSYADFRDQESSNKVADQLDYDRLEAQGRIEALIEAYCKDRELKLKLQLSAAKIREHELLDELAPYRAMKEQIKGDKS